MLVGVCCECQQSRIPVIYDSAQGYTIQQHSPFGFPCKGEGTAPQATYEWSDPAGPDQMPEGVQVVIGNTPDPECCFDRNCNHRPDPPKPPGVFGTIGDLILEKINQNLIYAKNDQNLILEKNGKQKTKKRG